MSACPTFITGSSIQIDGFTMNDLFLVTDKEPVLTSTEVIAFTGDEHRFDASHKDQFEINFPLLTQAQMSQLKQICRQVGANAFHTVIYSTPELVRKYDGTSQPYDGINSDVNRIRKKVSFQAVAFPHLAGQADLYECTIKCRET